MAALSAEERLARYAELAVRVGANVQKGQTVFVLAHIEHTSLARAITRAAYEAGATYVAVEYRDPHIRKAMIELGPDEALTYSPEWQKTFARASAGNALIATTGDPEPELLSDLDGERVGRARMKEVNEIAREQWSTARSTGPASRIRPRAGRRRCSASPTSSASGRPSRSARGSTSRIRWRPGATTWRGSSHARQS